MQQRSLRSGLDIWSGSGPPGVCLAGNLLDFKSVQMGGTRNDIADAQFSVVVFHGWAEPEFCPASFSRPAGCSKSSVYVKD